MSEMITTAYFGHDLFWPRPHQLSRSVLGIFEGEKGKERGRDETLGPERVKARTQIKGGGKKGGGPAGLGARMAEGAKFRVFFAFSHPIFIFFSLSGDLLVSFFLSPGLFVSFFVSLGVFSWNFGGVLVGRDLQCSCSRHQIVVKPPAACRSPPTDQNTTKIPREDPQRVEKRHEKIPRERKKE